MLKAMAQSLSSVKDGLRDSTPIFLGYIPLGIAFGIVLVTAGIPGWWAPIFATVVYAGSMEFLLVSLITGGVGLVTVALSALFVNGRHLFYGLSFPRNVPPGRLARAYSIYSLTDEVYAVTAAKDHSRMTWRYLLTVQLCSHLSWVLGACLGALTGSSFGGFIPQHTDVADFVLTALFTVLAIEAYKANPDSGALVVASVSAVVTVAVGGRLAMFCGLLTLSLCLSALYLRRRRSLSATAAGGGGADLNQAEAKSGKLNHEQRGSDE